MYSAVQQLVDVHSGEHLARATCDAGASGVVDSGAPKDLWHCMFASEGNCGTEYAVKLAIVLGFTLPNLISSRLVGLSLTVLVVFTLLPYFPFVLLGLHKAHMANLLGLPPAGVAWRPLLSNAYWSLTGFDCVSTLAGELDANGQRKLPLALLLAGVLMFFSYIGPLLAGAATDPDWRCWREGSLAHVAHLISGPWLGWWVLASTAVANWGLFSAELIEDSFQLQGMAEVGIAPRVFRHRLSLTGAPIVAIALQLLIISLLVSLGEGVRRSRARVQVPAHVPHASWAQVSASASRFLHSSPLPTRRRARSCCRL